MRTGFQQSLMKLGHSKGLHVVTGDHGYALFDEFKSAFPERFHNVGVSEANAVSLAAGMAKTGLPVLVYGLASFIPGRVFEFLKIQLAIENLPVLVVGDGGGVVYSTLGHSHQSLEDLSLVNSLPNFEVWSPSSDGEVSSLLEEYFCWGNPAYMRLGKSDGSYSGNSPTGAYPYVVFGAASARISCLTHGSTTSLVLEALADLPVQLDISVWSSPVVGGRNFAVPDDVLRAKRILVIEEHFDRGGLASQVRRLTSNTGPSVAALCADFRYHDGVGDYPWTLSAIGLSLEKIKDFLVGNS